MLKWIRDLFQRQPQAVFMPQQHYGTIGDPLDGAVHRRTRTINGVPIDAVMRETRQLTLENGLVLDESNQGIVICGDGTATATLDRDFARCDLCWAAAIQAVERGECSSESALVLSLCRANQIKRSTLSGTPLCPRHAREIETENGPMIVSTIEADQIAHDRAIQRPVNALMNLFVEREEP